MTTVDATWDAVTSSVLLEVEPSGIVTAVLRSDVNGAGVPVRTLEDQLPTEAPFVLRDYEAAHGLVVYTVVDGADGASTSVTVALPGPRLASVVLPQALADPELVLGYTAARTPATTVHEVIGRADPVPVLGPLRSRRGELQVWCSNYEVARAVEAVYDVAEVVLLRQPWHPGMDMYHVAAGGDVVVEPEMTATRTRWRVTVPYREVRRPTDPLRGGLGWTFDVLTATYPAFNTLPQAFATLNDLTAGPVAS